MLSTKYIGMDIHKETISIAVISAGGKSVMECVVSSHLDNSREVNPENPQRIWRVKTSFVPKVSSSELVTTGSADSHLPLSVLNPPEAYLSIAFLDHSCGGFHLRIRSCSDDLLPDSPVDQFGGGKMNPVSAVARHQMPPTRREMR